MMISPNEINSQSRMMVAQRHEEAEQYRLAQVALGQADQARGRSQRRGRVSQLLSGLLARLRVARLGV
jgi:hypothetical protein